jgi:hypothetical protein
MKSYTEQVEKELKKIESAIHRHGFWRPPAGIPVGARLSGRVTPETEAVGRLMNRIFFIRCLPFCARIFGPAKSSTAQAFVRECKSDRDKMEFVRVQLNQLISDLQALGLFRNPPLEKIAA